MLASSVSLIDSKESSEIDWSSSRERSVGLEKPVVLFIVDSFFFRAIAERNRVVNIRLNEKKVKLKLKFSKLN